MTEEEFAEWRRNKLLYGMHRQRLIDRNTAELLKYNQTAVKYINGEVPQIFASGYNNVAEQIPDSPVAGFDFELINADTVNNLIHEDGIILPPKKKVDPEKDKAWNAKLINAQLLQGIMQGESIPEMAKRMQTVANSDLAGATRTARTMHTAAQNAGRQSGYNKAAEQGIVFEKTWLAANNERTRLSHSLMNGQTVAHDEKFVSPVTGVKLMFPGDWNAEGGDVGSELYNCRCTLITKFKGFKKLNGEALASHEYGHGHEDPEQRNKHEIEHQIENIPDNYYDATADRAKAYITIVNILGFADADPSLNEVDEKLLTENVRNLIWLENRFGVINQSYGSMIGDNDGEATAYTSRRITYPTRQNLSLCPWIYKDYDSLIEHERAGIESGQTMPCSEKYLAVCSATHEYGHMLLSVLIQEEYKKYGWTESNPRIWVDESKTEKEEKFRIYERLKEKVTGSCYNEIIEIAKNNNSEFELSQNISSYAGTSKEEFFAEVFMNSQCGAPNELGKAMNEWLKKKGLIKNEI